MASGILMNEKDCTTPEIWYEDLEYCTLVRDGTFNHMKDDVKNEGILSQPRDELKEYIGLSFFQDTQPMRGWHWCIQKGDPPNLLNFVK